MIASMAMPHWLTAWLRPTSAAPVEPPPTPAPDLIKKFIECKDCHERFPLHESEIAFLAQKGWPEFVRCKPCRRAKRLLKEKAAR